MNSIRLICTREYYDILYDKVLKKNSLIVADSARAEYLINSHVGKVASIDSVSRWDPSKKTVCVYYNIIYRVGGAEMASYTLVKYLSQFYNVIFAFDQIADGVGLVFKISEYADVRSLEYNYVSCDTLIIASLYCKTSPIKYGKCIRWVHGCFMDIEAWKSIIKKSIIDDSHRGITEYVCVGEECARQCKEIYSRVGVSIEPTVIYNILKENIEEMSNDSISIEVRDLTLVTVSRISGEKGFERILSVAKFLKNNKIDFIWYIVGDGADQYYVQHVKSLFSKIPEVVFVGYRENPYPYYKAADFHVLLSDYEAYSVAVAEAMYLGVPSITTDFSSAREIIKTSGRIIKKDLSDLSLDIFKKVDVNDKAPDNREKWLEVI